MKLSLAVLASLAICASAFPVRVISLTGPAHDYLPPKHAGVMATNEGGIAPHPCPKHRMAHPAAAGPLGALLTRLGLAPEAPHFSPSRWEVVSAVRQEEGNHRAIDAWKHHVEEMIHEAEDKVVPIMQGGMVKILPVMNEQGEFEQDATRKQLEYKHHHHGEEHQAWKALEGHGGVKHYHHRHVMGKTFACRLGRALRSLTPSESLAMTFVLGAGVGSILHFIFMIMLITIRVCRGKKLSCAERRAARQARREARKAGGVKLDSAEGGTQTEEVVPCYSDSEQAALVEKA